MKHFTPDIPVASKPQRPLPANEILWGSQEGGQNRFPTSTAAWERKHSGNPVPLLKFSNSVADAQDPVWLVDEYLLTPDRKSIVERIVQILAWLPLGIAANDIRLLTKQHKEIEEENLKNFQIHAQKINAYSVRRGKQCRIEVRTHLTHRNCNFIHDRFAIIDDELWHFGGTTDGFQATVSASSRGWRAVDHGAIDFFEEIWNKGE